MVRTNIVLLIDCPTADMTADLMTKALPAQSFRQHCDTAFGYTLPTAPSVPSRIANWQQES